VSILLVVVSDQPVVMGNYLFIRGSFSKTYLTRVFAFDHFVSELWSELNLT